LSKRRSLRDRSIALSFDRFPFENLSFLPYGPTNPAETFRQDYNYERREKGADLRSKSSYMYRMPRPSSQSGTPGHLNEQRYKTGKKRIAA
jgi:hypothetical protein